MEDRNKTVAEQIKESRIANVRRMHDLVCRLNNEGAYMWWASEGVPDCPQDPDDFEWFAEDDENYEELVTLFLKILKRYGKDGFVTEKR